MLIDCTLQHTKQNTKVKIIKRVSVWLQCFNDRHIELLKLGEEWTRKNKLKWDGRPGRPQQGQQETGNSGMICVLP